jgi:hypothetical protein
MILSTNEYNLNPAHGIILGGVAQNFRQSPATKSKHFPDHSYHYEFWIPEDEDLYACIHCTHNRPNINLSRLIFDLFPLISKRLSRHGFEGIANVQLQGLAGVGNSINSHVINVQCLSHGMNYREYNASLMWHMIDVTNGII